MARRTEVGPCRAYYGDPTAGSGAMVLLGTMENVTVDANQGWTGSSSAELGGAIEHSTARAMPADPNITAEIADWTKAKLQAINIAGVNTGTAVGFGDSYKSIDPGTLFLLPLDDVSSGVSSDYGIWIPSATPIIGAFARYGRPTRNGETGPVFYSVSFRSNYREEDQTSPTPVAIPAGFRLGWYGDPSELSLSWTIA